MKKPINWEKLIVPAFLIVIILYAIIQGLLHRFFPLKEIYSTFGTIMRFGVPGIVVYITGKKDPIAKMVIYAIALLVMMIITHFVLWMI